MPAPRRRRSFKTTSAPRRWRRNLPRSRRGRVACCSGIHLMARRPSPADSVRVRQERGIGIGRRPRVLMLGTPRDAYGPLGRLADALCSEVIVREAPPPARLLPAMLAVRRAARSGEAEVVHLWDERHACVLLALPRGVPVTMTVGERRTGRSPLAWL